MKERHSLSDSLRTSTMAAHKNAETSSFMKLLFKGDCSKESYQHYLWALHEVYQTLESVIDKLKDHSVINKVYFPNLFRLQTLKNDLQEWGFSLNEEIPETVQQAVKLYCERITHLDKERPELLTAHIYVRYLGDLSGGQMLKKVLPKNFNREIGFSFYDFSNIDANQTKNEFRQRLDEIGEMSDSLSKEICEEAILSFSLNTHLFKSLDKAH